MDSSSDTGEWDPSAIVKSYTTNTETNTSTNKSTFEDIKEFWNKNSPKSVPQMTWNQPQELPKRIIENKVTKPRSTITKTKQKINSDDESELSLPKPKLNKKPEVVFQHITIPSVDSDNEIQSMNFGSSESDLEISPAKPNPEKQNSAEKKSKSRDNSNIQKTPEPKYSSTKKQSPKQKLQKDVSQTETEKPKRRRLKSLKEIAEEKRNEELNIKQPKKAKAEPKKSKPTKKSPTKIEEIKESSQKSKRSKAKTQRKYDFNMVSSEDEQQIIIPEVVEPTPEDDDLPIALRRSKRIRVKPLKHWKNEHIKYGVGEGNLRYVMGVENYSQSSSQMTQNSESASQISEKVKNEPKTKQSPKKEQDKSADLIPGPYEEEEITIQPESSRDFGVENYGRHLVHIDGYGTMTLNGRQYRLEDHADYFVPPNQSFQIGTRPSSSLTLLLINYK